MIKKYRFTFSVGALILFISIMIPNFIWFAVPADNDILRTASNAAIIDNIGQVCQILMIASLIFIKNTSAKVRRKTFGLSVVVTVFLYYICWILYYIGIRYAFLILGLTVFPCTAFLLFAVLRKNYIAVIPITAFTVCHFINCIITFIV